MMLSNQTITVALAAFGPEIDPLKSIQVKSSTLHIATVGIGAIAAAIETYEILTTLKAQHQNTSLQVIFIGSVGAYSKEVPLLSMISATSSIASDYLIRTNQAYIPQSVIQDIPADLHLKQCIDKALNNSSPNKTCIFAPINTSPSITISTQAAELMGIHFENLELHGIASACKKLNIPWGSLSCVSNYIGPRAQNQWQENYLTAAELTAKHVLKVINSV